MWVYRLLLRLYPSGFRATYGDEMSAVFSEKLRHASNPFQVAGIWLEALFDVVRHALPLHLETLAQDVRYTRRSLFRVPTFSLTVIAVTALGIGANTAVFTVVDRVLIRPLPFPEADRLVRIWESPPGYSQMEVSPPNYRDWRDMVETSFEGLAAYSRHSVNLVGDDQPERLLGARLSSGLLPLLGIPPLRGQGFLPEDDVAGAQPKVLLSYALWQRRFGGAEDVIGQTALLDDIPHVIVGVMPPTFRFPDQRSDYWTSLQFVPGDIDRNNNYLEVIGRLRDGVTVEMARTEMTQVMARLEAEYPVANGNNGASVNRLQDEVPWQARMLLTALMGASLAVLLIACTNLANLLLARARVRRRELAVRSSLGAGRQRLVRQLLTESISLAAVGGVGGVLLAYAALPLLVTLVPSSLPIATDLTLDLRVLLFATGITVLTGVGFGAFPALRAGRDAVITGLREGGRGGSGRGEGLRATLVVVEVAACVALLIASGLLIRALDQVRDTDPGFRAEGVLTARTWLPLPRYETVAARHQFYSRVLEETRALPGVENAAFISFLPLVMGGGIWPVEIDGQSRNRSGNQTASLRYVTPGYFDTMDIPMVTGRDVSPTDTQDTQYAAVVSRSFVERYWPEQEALGRTFRFAFNERTVVGVVEDVHVRGLERRSEPQVYLPYQQVADGGIPFYTPKDLAIRTSGDPAALVPLLRDIVRRVDPTQPVMNVQRLTDIVAEDTASRDVQLKVLGTFAGLAFLLAAIGIHGLLSFTATLRAREIGVRMALGAQRSGIATMFLREGARLGVLGVVVGAGAGYAAGRGMEALLFGISPWDPVTFGAAAFLALVMAVIGSLPPALRAASVDPNRVIRDA